MIVLLENRDVLSLCEGYSSRRTWLFTRFIMTHVLTSPLLVNSVSGHQLLPVGHQLLPVGHQLLPVSQHHYCIGWVKNPATAGELGAFVAGAASGSEG